MNACEPDTLIHGDCLKILPQLAAGSVNFVLTDPPYLTCYAPRDGRTALTTSGGNFALLGSITANVDVASSVSSTTFGAAFEVTTVSDFTTS